MVLVLVAAVTADVIVEKRSGPSKGLLAALGGMLGENTLVTF